MLFVEQYRRSFCELAEPGLFSGEGLTVEDWNFTNGHTNGSSGILGLVAGFGYDSVTKLHHMSNLFCHLAQH